MRRSKVYLIIITVISISFLLNGVSFTQEENQEDLLKRGIYDFRHENYDEALEIFKDAREADPESSLAAYYLGLTYKRLENYVEAKPHLEASIQMTPKIKGALIELIDLLYRLDDIDGAKKYITIAEAEGIRPAQAAFLKGLTQIKAEEYEEAVKSFKRAKSLDSKMATPANYQIATAYVKLGKFAEAKEAFKDVISMDPHADITAYASKYIDAIEKKDERDKPYNVVARFAFEYDTNVILKPSDTTLVGIIAEEGDTRQIWDVKGDYTFKSPNNFLGLTAGYGFRLYDQNDLEEYDIAMNNFNLQPSMTFENTYMTFPASFTHTIVDDSTYLTSTTAGNVNNIRVGPLQMAQIGTVYKYKDYYTAPSDVEDRTGSEIIGTGGFFWFFMNNEGVASIRVSGNRDWAEGDNWKYWGNRTGLGLLLPLGEFSPLLEKFKLNTQGEVNLQFYDNTHTVFDEKRRDQLYAVSTLLSYEIFKNAEVQVQYTYVNNQSNIGVYEYDRHIVGTAVQYRF